LPVKKITKTFNYSKKDLIELVLKIEDYKIILSIDKNNKDLKIIADLEIGFKSFRDIYTSN